MDMAYREAGPEYNTNSAWIKGESQADVFNEARKRNWMQFASSLD